ncbi:hypothetical protein A4A49_58327 [Nicotiana attenuata]|uniref:Uncharacterized protein n=1 Tax=Nicotiana attenuata TaxID=49451 RepID=A0A314LBL6_NICAT|nr:hypothetical protein A4A49_58327 [Nicotiana attenuata]
MDSFIRLKKFPKKSLKSRGEAPIGAKAGLFWEHLPPLDPEAVAKMMQEIRNHIRGLEERKEALLQERRELTARVARIASDSQRE